MCYMGCPHEYPDGSCRGIRTGGYCDDEYWEEETEPEEYEDEEEPEERENHCESRASAS